MRDEKGFLISDEKVEKELALLSFVAPMGGMFGLFFFLFIRLK